jgi:site-specific DNA-cytosine methylase
MSQLKNGRWIALSLEQLMKMQGLPRSYKFPVGTSATSKLKLVGNAVCPPIAKSLLLAIREALLT